MSVCLSVCLHVFYVLAPPSVAGVTFDPVSYNVNEGDVVNLTLKVNMMLETTVTVTVATMAVTAGGMTTQ